MMWIVGAAVWLLAQDPSLTLSIRVVDPYRAPLAGIRVQLEEVSGCVTTRAESSNRRVGVTTTEGSAEFIVPRAAAYRITVESQGGFEGRDDCLDLVRPGHYYSQLELRPDLSAQLTTHPVSSGGSRTAVGLGDVVGVYGDDGDRLYEVTLLDGTQGVALSRPRGSLLNFSERDGLTFRGPEGTIRFRVERGQVVGFDVTWEPVRARKRQ